MRRPSIKDVCIGVTVDLHARRNSSKFCRCGKWCARCSGTDGAFSSFTSWPGERRWMLRVTVKHCRNCDGPFRTSGAGCLLPVLSCCTITLGHTRLDCQHISCRSSAGRCLFMYHIVRVSRPVIFFFSYASRNSNPVSVFRMTWRRRWVLHMVPIPGGRLLRHRIQKLVPRYDKCLNFEVLTCLVTGVGGYC